MRRPVPSAAGVLLPAGGCGRGVPSRGVLSEKQADSRGSYALAETLKYLYLLFAPAETLDFDTVTFNTEAHPLRRTW